MARLFGNIAGNEDIDALYVLLSALDTDTSLAANSDAKVATQKAVKAYVDALGGGGGIYAHIFNSADIGIPSATSTYLTFDSERNDTSSFHSTSSNTGRMVIPTTGRYTMTFLGRWAGTASAAGSQVWYRLNGSTIFTTNDAYNTDSNFSASHVLTIERDFTAADYIEVGAFHGKTGTQNLLSQAYSSLEWWIRKVA